jgi:hypothetical protein
MQRGDRRQAHRHPFALSWIDVAWIGAYAAVGARLTIHMGQDLNWDLLNYHFYNAYWLAAGRFARDVHAAGVQSFLNPLVDLPLYLAARAGISPTVFFLALGALHGGCLFLIHRLTVLLLPGSPPAVAAAGATLAAATAAFGSGFLSEVGNTMHDNTLAIPLLLSMGLLLAEVGREETGTRARMLGAGVLAGAAAGMKLSLGPICLGLGAAALLIPARTAGRLVRAALFSVGVGFGVVLTAGYWMWVMFVNFQSPLFPFVNTLFASPYAPLQNFADARFLPKTAGEFVFYPFYWMAVQNTVTEPLFRDGRMAAAMMCLAGFVLWIVLSRGRTQAPEDRLRINRLAMVAVFWIVSYVVWVKMFAIYRYVISLELLTGTILIGLLALMTADWRRWLALAIPVCLALSMTVRVPDWGRTPWSTSYFGVDAASLSAYEGATVLMWDFPQAYVAPYFPRSTRFVRIFSNWGLTDQTLMWTRVVSAAETAPGGQIFLLDLEQGMLHEQQPAALGRLGLQRAPAPCRTHSSFSGGFRMCPLQRVGQDGS